MTVVRRSRRALLNYLFGKTSDFDTQPTIYVGLSTTTPTETGTNVTEATGSGYARVATSDTDWSAATDANPAVTSNATAVTFPAATGDWSTGSNMTHFVLYDAASSGNVIAWGALTTAKAVASGDTASFAIGALQVQAGDAA